MIVDVKPAVHKHYRWSPVWGYDSIEQKLPLWARLDPVIELHGLCLKYALVHLVLSVMSELSPMFHTAVDVVVES